jgi:organic radical activating enzyme
MKMESVKLIENFYSFQGEGPDTGKSMVILRFKYCDRVENKKPCQWCDTLVKMRIQNEARYPIRDIQLGIKKHKCGILITGGEPTYGNNLPQTIALLNQLEYPIANVETNGHQLCRLRSTLSLDSKNIKFIFSPKLFSKGDLVEALDIVQLVKNDPRVYLKVVWDFMVLTREFLYSLGNFNNSRIFIMPEGKTKKELFNNAPAVFDLCEELKFNFSSRAHIIYDFI